MSKMFARIICQTIEWKVNYSTAKNVILLLFCIWLSSAGSSSSVIVAPFASAAIRPVVNRFNQDTALFFAFSWPYMVKLHNSEIIKILNWGLDPGGRGVLPIMAYTGRVRPKGVSFSGFRYMKGILLVEVYKRVGKSVISVYKKAQKSKQIHFMVVKQSRKRSGYMIYSCFKDNAFTIA